jgi:hypothetical protein
LPLNGHSLENITENLKIKNTYKYLYISIKQENSSKTTMVQSEVINRGREDSTIDKGKQYCGRG